MVPVWAIYSYWSAAMAGLWLAGLLPFSPLASCVATLIGSIVFVVLRGTIFPTHRDVHGGDSCRAGPPPPENKI